MAAMTRRFRLHRREWRHDGRTYQVMALRPADPARYAVTMHDRWTLVRSDLAGARLLGRLLWGLSYQRRPDTLLVLDPGRMVADPDDGRSSPPVVFGVAARTVLTPSAAQRLSRPQLWRSRPAGTVTCNTSGFPSGMAALHAWQDDRRAGLPIPDRYIPAYPAAAIHASPAAVTVLAVPEVLRRWATLIGDAGDYWHHDESCTEPDWETGFDVHAVRHFHRRVSVARRARAEVLTAPDCPTDPTLIDERVRTHVDVVAARRPGPWDPAPTITP
jgi:hypothetical protein